MMKLLPTLGCLALLGAGAQPAAQVELEFALEFRPRDGASATLEFERVLTLEFESSGRVMTYDGEVQEGQDPPGVELEMTETERLRFTDTYTVEEGALTAVQRHFAEIGNDFRQAITDPAGETFEREDEGASQLEGVTVLFRRAEEEPNFSVAFVDESTDLDAELLEGLVVSADLSGFLPAQAVAAGDHWDVDLAAFVSMTNLSGDLHVLQEGQDPEETGDYGRQFDEHLRGEIEAELVELREEDGARLAVVHLRMELTTRIELASEVEDEEVKGSEQERHAFGIEIEGDLLWDLNHARARALTLRGEVTLDVAVQKAYAFEGHEVQIEETQAFEGTITFEASVD